MPLTYEPWIECEITGCISSWVVNNSLVKNAKEIRSSQSADKNNYKLVPIYCVCN